MKFVFDIYDLKEISFNGELHVFVSTHITNKYCVIHIPINDEIENVELKCNIIKELKEIPRSTLIGFDLFKDIVSEQGEPALRPSGSASIFLYELQKGKKYELSLVDPTEHSNVITINVILEELILDNLIVAKTAKSYEHVPENDRRLKSFMDDYINRNMSLFDDYQALIPVMNYIHCPYYTTRINTYDGEIKLPGCAYAIEMPLNHYPEKLYEHLLKLSLNYYGIEEKDFLNMNVKQSMTYIVKALTFLSNSYPYISDKDSTGRKDVERFKNLQESKGGDCDDLSDHIFGMAVDLRENKWTNILVNKASSCLQYYIPVEQNGAVSSAAYSTNINTNDYGSHLWCMFIPRYYFLQCLEQAGEQNITGKIEPFEIDLPIFIGEGTAYVHPNPLEAKNPLQEKKYNLQLSLEGKYPFFRLLHSEQIPITTPNGELSSFYKIAGAGWINSPEFDFHDFTFTYEDEHIYSVYFDDLIYKNENIGIKINTKFTKEERLIVDDVLKQNHPIRKMFPPHGEFNFNYNLMKKQGISYYIRNMEHLKIAEKWAEKVINDSRLPFISYSLNDFSPCSSRIVYELRFLV